MKQIELLDSTLRDGAQGEGISFSVDDKCRIAHLLDELGLPLVEAGNPGSNPKDLAFFSCAGALAHAQLVAFGSTRRKDMPVTDDANVQALLDAHTPVVCIFGKTWDLHVRDILKTTPAENRRMIFDTVSFFTQKKKRVLFDAEHFFDGYKDDAAFALDMVAAAAEAGADTLVLCDTNGGSFPTEIFDITQTVVQKFPALKIGIHVHNDNGMAVANSLMAVEAGAAHVQGTLLGFGERTGNANLSTILANLQLKRGCACIPAENMALLTDTARQVAEIANLRLAPEMPFVGRSAFAHKAGMHADGVLKNSRTFEHVPPDSVGNERRFLMSEITGRGAVLDRVLRFAPHLDKNHAALPAILDTLKQRELDGYQYEAADASFELLVRRRLEDHAPFFELIHYRITGEKPYEEGQSAIAYLKVRVGEQTQIAGGEGNGPVNALDKALRAALAPFFPVLENVFLVDYKVRVLGEQDATAAKVRVLITSSDGVRDWTTVGVSSDILEASWQALSDSIEYVLWTGEEGA